MSKQAYIRFNNENIKEAKQAERKKAMFENKGYTYVKTEVNVITGNCVITYNTNKN